MNTDSLPSLVSRGIPTSCPGRRQLALLSLALSLFAGSSRATEVTAKSTEGFLNLLGVNTHLDGNSGWNTNTTQVGQQIGYIGVRLQRDWPNEGASVNTSDGSVFWTVRQMNPLTRMWLSIGNGGQADQRVYLSFCQDVYNNYGSNLVHVMGGPNEPDVPYSQYQYGNDARLPDSALVQGMLYNWANPLGVKVSQMEFGAGWTASNAYKGDYLPSDPGINYTSPIVPRPVQTYTAGPADFGGAHTYLIDNLRKPFDRLKTLRDLAVLTTPNKPVAHTEIGAYTYSNLSEEVYGQYMVMGALDSAAAGDVGYIAYGLQDGVAEGTYGFYTTQNDPTPNDPNPIAHYYHNLTTLLQTLNSGLTYAPGQPATFFPDKLNVTYSNPAQVSHYVMQKATGEFVIAAYSEQLINGSEVPVTETISFGQTFASVKIFNVQTGTTAITALSNVSACTLTMDPSDTYLIVLSNGGQVIVKDTANPSGITKTGTWASSTGVAGYYGPDYLYAGTGGGATATFTPPIAVAGSYHVYARWTADPNRATNALYTVHHTGGTTGFGANQRVNNGTWVLLGAFSFAAGSTGKVVLSNTGANGTVVADAVKFVKD